MRKIRNYLKSAWGLVGHAATVAWLLSFSPMAAFLGFLASVITMMLDGNVMISVVLGIAVFAIIMTVIGIMAGPSGQKEPTHGVAESVDSQGVPELLIRFEEAAELLEKEYGVEFDPQRLRCGSNQPASYLECAAIALFRRAGEGVLEVYGRESVCTDSNKEFIKEPSVIPAEKARQLGDSLLRIQLEPPMTIAGYANEELEYLHGFQKATKQERDQPIRYKDFWVSKQDLARVWGQS